MVGLCDFVYVVIFGGGIVLVIVVGWLDILCWCNLVKVDVLCVCYWGWCLLFLCLLLISWDIFGVCLLIGLCMVVVLFMVLGVVIYLLDKVEGICIEG